MIEGPSNPNAIEQEITLLRNMIEYLQQREKQLHDFICMEGCENWTEKQPMR